MLKKFGNEMSTVFIMLGMSGAVLFFPMKLNGGRTCLVHYFLMNNRVHTEIREMGTAHDHLLERSYVIPYGLLWWTSLGCIVIGTYLLKGNRDPRGSMNKELTSNVINNGG